MHEVLEPPFAVVGLGLIGGSVARSLRSAYPHGDVIVWNPDPHTRETALRHVAVTKSVAQPSDTPELAACSTIFVCTPLMAMPEVFSSLSGRTGDAVVTDVAGVKRRVESWASELLPNAPFVGGHPMAGGPAPGFEASRSDLFDGAPVALCPRADVDAAPLVELWKKLGGEPEVMSADEHDRLVAFSSHGPYLAALAHLQVLGDNADNHRLIGRGFLDATRHAEFSPEVMATVASENSALADSVRELASALNGLADTLSDPEALRELAVALRKRRRDIDR